MLVWFVGGPGLRIPLVCLSVGVAMARCIATSKEASAFSSATLSRRGLGRRGVQSAFLAQTRQSLVSLPLSALVPELRSGVRCEAAAWPGCSVACVVCSMAALSRPCAGAEAGARLASRACGLWVPLLAASDGGMDCFVLVSAVAVLPQSLSVPRCPSLHGGYSPAVPSFHGHRWSGFGQTRASDGSRFGVLSVPWSRSWVPARDGTGMCGSPTWWCVHGPGWFCLWALDLVE
ncbi:hypothetical protein Taro_007860, partial [Colocasia esculenta]|nr:hypothetical protein [Colocasia esculenta]